MSQVSRGFVLVQTRDKTQTPDIETGRSDVEQDTEQRGSKQSRDEAGDVAYRQRVVVSAKTASNDTSRPTSALEDGVDLGLEVELAANQRRRSSNATWDSVSVDSLVMYDDDDATVHAAALYSSSKQRQLDDEFVDKLRRLQDKWTNASADDDDDDDDDTVWVPMPLTQSTAGDSHQPETDGTMTSLEDTDNTVILSDCVTTQHVVINIKLPRRCRHSASTIGKQRVPTVPFRQLRLRREVRYTDDADTPNSTSATAHGTDCFTPVTSSRDVDEFASDDVDEELVTAGDSVVLTADGLLGGEDLSTLSADAEIEFDDRDSSRSVELVPVCDGAGRSASQRVDVSRCEATRVVRLTSTSSSRLVYSTPSLMQTVHCIRRALLSRARGAREDGVAVTCEAVETVTRRGDQSQPVVRNIVVDCLQPPSS